MDKKCRNIQCGFTLIELLCVVAILGIVSAVGTVQYKGYIAVSQELAAEYTHSRLVTFINGEIAKCNAGASTMFDAYSTPVACSSTTAEIVTALAGYTSEKNWNNPYDKTVTSVRDDAAAPVQGFTHLFAISATNISITSLTKTGETLIISAIFRE